MLYIHYVISYVNFDVHIAKFNKHYLEQLLYQCARRKWQISINKKPEDYFRIQPGLYSSYIDKNLL